jgi:eukaryotic-like serine/threonine-protein kinase
MTPERWRQVEEIYHAVLDRSDSQRMAFLDQACGSDSPLRKQVERLLKAHVRAGAFLDTPAMEVAAAANSNQPASLIGTHISHYQIVALLGVGGMGEVYRAFDSRLNRHVAIKIVAPAPFDDSQARSRLLREARAAASLNHSNVCAIYEVGEADGQTFIAMELIDGTSLDKLIPDGGLPADKVLQYGRELAAAVAHAHDRGIVHRDLKPANIKITSEGILKVLDFGLAKAGTDSSEVDRATASTDLTVPGTVLGTAAYMSPEQAQGKPIDKRTDIWAFGVVVYQMLTGRVPFAAGSFASTVAAILTTEPDWTSVPPEMQRVLRACLEKEPKSRLRDAGDAWKLLEAPVAIIREPSRRWMVAAASGILVGAAIAWAILRPPLPDFPRVIRWSITLVESGGGERGVALSRDGRVLAYTGRVLPVRPIWVRALNEMEGKPIPGTDAAAGRSSLLMENGSHTSAVQAEAR